MTEGNISLRGAAATAAPACSSAAANMFRDIQFDTGALQALCAQHGVQPDGATALQAFIANQLEMSNCRVAPDVSEDEPNAKAPKTEGDNASP